MFYAARLSPDLALEEWLESVWTFWLEESKHDMLFFVLGWRTVEISWRTAKNVGRKTTTWRRGEKAHKARPGNHTQQEECKTKALICTGEIGTPVAVFLCVNSYLFPWEYEQVYLDGRGAEHPKTKTLTCSVDVHLISVRWKVYLGMGTNFSLNYDQDIITF